MAARGRSQWPDGVRRIVNASRVVPFFLIGCEGFATVGIGRARGAALPKSHLVALLASPMRVTLTKSQLSTERGAELFKILCEITQDGMLTDVEVERLKNWLATSGAAALPSEKMLTDLLGRLLANGKISREERRELQKEIERILPPSQRAEAKEARERLDAIDSSIAVVPGGSLTDAQEDQGEDEESDDAKAASRQMDREDAREARRITKSQQKQRELEQAIKAHTSQPVGKTSYNIKLPDRRPYEPSATLKQKDFLWALGARDQAILDSLGKWQASAMIEQIQKQQNKSGCLALSLFILVPVIILALVVKCTGR